MNVKLNIKREKNTPFDPNVQNCIIRNIIIHLNNLKNYRPYGFEVAIVVIFQFVLKCRFLA